MIINIYFTNANSFGKVLDIYFLIINPTFFIGKEEF